ncbi:MAG: hypothetical protein ACU84H_09950 [Gammaproteobacteria bacterium]
MNNQQRKNRILILALFGMSIIPFLIAIVLKENPALLKTRTNYGQLIVPPVVTERGELTGYDRFSSDHMGELSGHWLIVNLIPGKECNDICRDAMYKSRQLQLMMNKDLLRTRRIVLLLTDVEPDTAGRWWQDDKALLRFKPNETFIKKVKEIRSGQVPDGMLMLMDPLGNIMMQYDPGFDPYRVKSDLSHLLKISQIG